MTGAIVNVLDFLISIFFQFYLICILLRFLLQWVKADFYNPVCQFLIKVTNPLLVPLRRIIPGFFGLDFAAIVLAIIVQLVEVSLLALIKGLPLTPYLYFFGIIELILLVLNIFTFAILIRAILSWVNPNPYNPMAIILFQLTEPLLRPLRNKLQFSQMDFSPFVVIILIQVVVIFIRSLF
ncbi:YggT family protein [Thiotrichales bacterium 19S9-12]|nr:YggT family protein [Thiotrichales bacterium 19S9-11]MCF6812127.1 YggT family protein [Thiotrichales bacterium 19S9-12]